MSMSSFRGRTAGLLDRDLRQSQVVLLLSQRGAVSAHAARRVSAMNAQNFDASLFAKAQKRAETAERRASFGLGRHVMAGSALALLARRRLRRLGGLGPSQRCRGRPGHGQGRPEPQGGAASRRRHHPDDRGAPGRQRQRGPGPVPARRRPDPGRAVDHPLATRRASRPRCTADRRA